MRKSLLHVLTTRLNPYVVLDQEPSGIIGQAGISPFTSSFFALPCGFYGFEGPVGSSESFTIRYWFRMFLTGGGAAVIHDDPPDSVSGFLAFQLSAYAPATAFPAALTWLGTASYGVTGDYYRGCFQFRISHETGTSNLLLVDRSPGSITFLATDTWHRVVIWYDAVSLEAGLQVDDALTTTILPSPAKPLQDWTLWSWWGDDDDVPRHLKYDEIAFWRGYVLTEAERLTDWNSGAGNGWPASVIIAARRPMAYWRFDPEDLDGRNFLSVT